MLSNLFRKAQTLGWFPDADAVNAQPGSLLRADNLTVDEKGALALRKGSSKIYSSMADLDVHTLRTLQLTGFDTSSEGTYRFLGVNNRLYRDGVDAGVTFDGTGDFAVGTDSYQAFIARGTTKKKFDGTTLNNWGIAPPAQAATLATATATSSTVATFNSSESPAFTVNEGTSNGFVTGSDGTGSGALELVPATTGRFSLTKTFAADTDYLNIAGSVGTDTDLFDMFIWLAEPTKVRKVTIMFGMGTGSDPFLQDYYSFEFDIAKDGASTKVKDQKTYSAASYGKYVSQVQSVLTPNDITKVSTPAQVRNVLSKLSGLVGPVSKPRTDAQAASPAWAHLSVTRGQFDRVGGTAGRNWTTIRGFKVVYQAVPGSTDVVRLDNAVYFGGGDRALTGDFKVAYRFVRDTGAYQELSPISPESAVITLTQQALQVTIPAASISGADAQVNQIWIYMYGGFLDTYYRVAVTGSTANSSTMRIDEFAKTADGAIDAADRTRLVNQGFSIPGFTPNADIVVSILKSEVDALIENESLEPGSIVPPDNIVAVEGPVASRMFALTDDGYVYVSGQRRPSSFSPYWALDLRQFGNPLWMKRTVGGIIVGMTGDIILIQGTGDESADHIQIDFTPIPLHIANAPVDQAVFTDMNTVVYRAADGLMALTGQTAEPVSQGVTTLLWRGFTRHDVPPLNITGGRFRLAVDNHILYMLAPEGDTTDSTSIIWRFVNQQWSRTVYPTLFRSIHREPNGDLVAGDTTGNLWLLEDGTQDAGTDIPINIRTPIDDGGEPLNRKDAFDLQFHADTGDLPAAIAVAVDSATTTTATFTAATSTAVPFRFNATSIGVFHRAQITVTGSFHRFVLQAFNLSYRKRPQQVMAVDTGAISPVEPGRFIWLRQIEIDCYSPSDLEVLTYIDDVLVNTSTIAVTAGKRSNHRVTLPKGIKGTRPRLLFRTTGADAAGNVGFEPYAVRIRTWSSGNESDRAFVQVWAVGEQLA